MIDASAPKLLTLDDLLARHDEEKHAFSLLTETEQARHQVRMRAHYASNPWAFLRDCVYTLDQVDQVRPIKPFPSDLEYLEFLTAVWIKHKLLAIPKSRRMTCSWNFISLYTHDTIFNSGRFNGFVSKKEDDAGELVARAEFIYNHIPAWRIPVALLPKMKNGKMSQQPPILEFPEINSKIQGFPQGADQLRQFTLSGILGDECAFWEHAQKFYSASKPTLDGGGRMTLISSRSPGFFKKIVFDKLDSNDLTFKEEPPPGAVLKKPIEGVEIWKNPANRFVVIDLHYTANPHKRGPAWREAVRSSMPIRDFLMEYEKSWQTYEGKPVYEDFNKLIHVVKGTIEPEPGLPLLIGWDFGLTPAAVIAQLVGYQLRVLEELLENDGSIIRLAPRVWKHLAVNYAPWLNNQQTQIFSFIDPAGFQRAQTDEKTCAGILRKAYDPADPKNKLGFTNVNPGPVDWESRKGAVEQFLVRTYGKGAAMIVSEDGCPILIEGFNGGYQYPEKAIEIEPANITPVKNKFSHPHDALQYVCWGANVKQKQYGRMNMSVPGYGFQKR